MVYTSNTYVPIDPFKTSITFSIKNIGRTTEERLTTDDDINTRPTRASNYRRLSVNSSNMMFYGHPGVYHHSRPTAAPAQEATPPHRLEHSYLSSRIPDDQISTSEGIAGVLPNRAAGGSSVPLSVPEKPSSYSSVSMHLPSVGDLEGKNDSSAHSQVYAGLKEHDANSRLEVDPPVHDPSEVNSNTLSTSIPVPATLHIEPHYPVQATPLVHSIEVHELQMSATSIHVSTYILALVLDTLPRQLYLHLLLRLPYMYFSRVTRIFEEAEMNLPQIKEGILEAAMQATAAESLPKNRWQFENPIDNLPFNNLHAVWQSFIDSLLREWKTLNIISVLLLSAILTVLQIDGAANDPLTRYTAIISMLCALMSLLYGCVYIIRFGTMRKAYKAAEWAHEAKRTRQSIFWNVWVLLAMPATWLAWSIILFITCIMSFVWRTGTAEDDDGVQMTRSEARAARIVVTLVLSLGLIYFALITATLRRYGEMMDRAWHRRIMGWVKDTVDEINPSLPRSKPSFAAKNVSLGRSGAHPATTDNVVSRLPFHPENKTPMLVKPHAPAMSANVNPHEKMVQQRSSNAISKEHGWEFDRQNIRMWTLLTISCTSGLVGRPDVGSAQDNDVRYPWDVNSSRGVTQVEELKRDIEEVWDNEGSSDSIRDVLKSWNETLFRGTGGQIALCQDISATSSDYGIIYLSSSGILPDCHWYYEELPANLKQRVIWVWPMLSSDSDPSNIQEPAKIVLINVSLLGDWIPWVPPPFHGFTRSQSEEGPTAHTADSKIDDERT